MTRSRFGSIRRRSSGRYEATHRHLGFEYRAPLTFVSHADARACLAVTEAEIHRGTWIDPVAGRMTVERYGTRWIEERIQLRPRTVELYTRLLGTRSSPSSVGGLSRTSPRARSAAGTQI